MKKTASWNVVCWFLILLHTYTSAETAGISLWLDAQQVERLAGVSTAIFVIRNGTLAPFLRDLDYNKNAKAENLPIVPADMDALTVNWEAGYRYHYSFEELMSENTVMMDHPMLSIPPSSLIPLTKSAFQVKFRCNGQSEGYATVRVNLKITDVRLVEEIDASPVNVRFRKQCNKVKALTCNPSCANGGVCDDRGLCECPNGFYGPTCEQALCNPHCYNNGICMYPGICVCQDGFHGDHCEIGLCSKSCGPHGLCMGPETCQCHRHWYGRYCNKKLDDIFKGTFRGHHKRHHLRKWKKHHKNTSYMPL